MIAKQVPKSPIQVAVDGIAAGECKDCGTLADPLLDGRCDDCIKAVYQTSDKLEAGACSTNTKD